MGTSPEMPMKFGITLVTVDAPESIKAFGLGDRETVYSGNILLLNCHRPFALTYQSS
jgi:hypothetical protein